MSGLLFLAVGASYTSSYVQMHALERSYARKQALAIAEAGVQRAIENLRNNWANSTTNESIGTTDGVFAVSVTNTTGTVAMIDSTGYIPAVDNNSAKTKFRAARRIRVQIVHNPTPSWFTWGMFAYESVNLGNAFQTSSKNSSSGVAHDWGNIGCLGDVTVGNGSKINGSIQAPGTIDNKKGEQGTNKDGQPNGEIHSAPVPPPAFPDADLNAAKTSNSDLTGITSLDPHTTPYNASTKILTVSNGVTLKPGTYYFKGITGSGNGVSLDISPAGPVKIYLDGDFNINGNSFTINSSGLPKNMQVFSTGTTFSIDGNGHPVMNMALLAPNATVSYGNRCDFFGSMVAKKIDLGNAKGFVYDEDLVNAGGPPGGNNNVLSWAEVQPVEAQ